MSSPSSLRHHHHHRYFERQAMTGLPSLLSHEGHQHLLSAAAAVGGKANNFHETLPLRIASIVVVAAVSLTGCLLAVIIGCNEEGSNLPHRLLKCLAAGVIGSVGFVHVLAEAADTLEQVTDFPLAYVVALAGAFTVLLLNQVFDCLVTSMRNKSRTNARSAAQNNSHHHHSNNSNHCHERGGGGGANGGPTAGVDLPGPLPSLPEINADDLLRDVPLHEGGPVDAFRLPAPSIRMALASPNFSIRSVQSVQGGHGDLYHIVYGFRKQPLLVAYVMELGIVFHSVLIGVGLGVLSGSREQVRTLLVAVCFHQFFEGVGLSTCILEAKLSRHKMACMIGLFSITTPLGIAVGIAVSQSYDPNSIQALLVQGLLNGFAAGILVYLALVEMLAEEFERPDVRAKPGLQAAMFAAVLVGATIMSALALFE